MVNAENLETQSHVAFRYVVTIANDKLAAFTECTLPTIEWEIEEVKEGGLNSYLHQLPGRRKASRLTLKHGIGKSTLFDWYLATLNQQFERKNITLTLCDAKGYGVVSWVVNQAYPIKWTGPQLKADANSIAIQTLEFACAEVTVELSTGMQVVGTS